MNNSLWQSVLGEIELSVSHANFKTWFRDTELLSYDNGTATIGVVNVFAKSQLEKRFDTQIREILKKNNLNVKDVNYKVKNTKKKITSRETTASLRDRANELVSRAPVNAKTPLTRATLLIISWLVRATTSPTLLARQQLLILAPSIIRFSSMAASV